MRWPFGKTKAQKNQASIKPQVLESVRNAESLKLSWMESEALKEIHNAEKGDLTAMPGSFLAFATNSVELKRDIARRLNLIVNSLDYNQIKKLDHIFRDKTSMEWYIDWKDIYHDASKLGITEDEQITVLGLGSFNPNGYFRERCLMQLSKYKDIKAYRFICLRLKDWVSEIRVAAKNYIVQIIENEGKNNLLYLLPYLDKVKESSYHQPTEVINIISETLLNDTAILQKGVLSRNIVIKRFCYKLLLQSYHGLDYFFERVMYEKDGFCRRMIVQSIFTRSSDESLQSWFPLLLASRLCEIRRITMDKLFKMKPDHYIESLKPMLLDKNAAVRDNARYLLNKAAKIDYRQFYIENLESAGSIYGLGETGSITDAKSLLPFLKSESQQKIVAAMTALANITGDEYTDYFVEQLRSEHAGMSKSAARILKNKNYLPYIETIHTMFLSEKHLHIRRNCAVLLISLSKWDAIRYILEMCEDDDRKIVLFGETAYRNWTEKFNRSYVSPTAAQIIKLRQFIDQNMNRIPQSRVDYLEFLIKSFK